jgi:hypothetical protein
MRMPSVPPNILRQGLETLLSDFSSSLRSLIRSPGLLATVSTLDTILPLPILSPIASPTYARSRSAHISDSLHSFCPHPTVHFSLCFALRTHPALQFVPPRLSGTVNDTPFQIFRASSQRNRLTSGGGYHVPRQEHHYTQNFCRNFFRMSGLR